MRLDPKVRRDGMCVQCRKPRLALAVADGDPFCTAVCCRAYHGIVWDEDQPVLTRTKDGTPVCSKHGERKVATNRYEAGVVGVSWRCQTCRREYVQKLRKSSPAFRAADARRKREQRKRFTPEQRTRDSAARREREKKNPDARARAAARKRAWRASKKAA